MERKDILQVNTLAELKAFPLVDESIVFMIGKNTIGDNTGGFYRWDASSTATEDLVYLNTIASSNSATGRWLRIFQRVRIFPQGTLVNSGGIKTFYATGATNASGEVTLNLTEENTANGTALFSEIWFNDSKANVTSLTASNAVSSFVKSSSLKTTTHGFFKANALTLTLGLLYSPLAAAPAGIPVQFVIHGV